MIIFSKEKDFYDGVAGTMGIDRNISYNRKTIEYDVSSLDIPDIFRYENGFHNNYRLTGIKKSIIDLSRLSIDKTSGFDGYEPFIIGFCGKAYIGYYLHKYIDRKTIEICDIIYDVNQIKSITKSSFFNKSNGVIDDIMNYDFSEVFQQFKTPIFLRTYTKGSSKFIINPILKEYKFYRVFDSFLAFQEIQMYIGGVLGSNENKIVKIEDKYKIEQHGFDKWSFRKEPTKK